MSNRKTLYRAAEVTVEQKVKGIEMTAQPNVSDRFVRRTQLSANEYHKNFLKLDEGIIAAVTSAEADKVTPLMSKIYLRLVNAPTRFWEREGVLRFEAESREGNHVKAWAVLCETLGVASATASKALTWLHDSGIIGYFAGKNGVGVRIFLNRASTSIGVRAATPGQKILRFPPASSNESPASPNEPAFNDSFAVPEILDSDKNRHAPENGADAKPVGKKSLDPIPHLDPQPRTPIHEKGREVEAPSQHSGTASVDEIVERLKRELEPCVKAAATQAAAQTATREIARTREWFETKALPKAVRVAQHETFDLLRKHGTLDERERRARAGLEVGRAASDSYTPPVAHSLSPEEVRETAETCVALLEAQGRSIDVTLSEISSEGGGWLLPDDAPRVREAALALLQQRGERR
ncbi:MAG: hypothetical protein ACRD9R_14720 [Pyrinomonadaceae bacterium]